MKAQFEPEMIEEWIDPFDSITIKIMTLFVYLIESSASIVMFFFVAYETQGYAGHYRTVINQLLSYFYGTVRAHSIQLLKIAEQNAYLPVYHMCCLAMISLL